MYFDKKKNLTKVDVYDTDDIVAISVLFSKIDYKANLNKSDFDINKMIDENCCNTDNDEEKLEEQESSSILNDIVYPLYVPANTFLKEKEVVDTEAGERAILTFNGDKNFVLIEEVMHTNDEFEIIPVYGDPLMLSNTIGALSSNSLSWNVDNVSYYLASNDLSTAEILSIADSLNVVDVVLEK